MTNIAALARPKFKSERITQFQTAEEIREQLQRAEYESRPFSRKVAKFFKKSSDYETCRNLWRWLRENINYTKEPRERQTAKTIERFIVDGYGDCKHYATTSVGVLNACGVPAWFVLAGQHLGDKRPNHAYACALVDGKIVVIDPCRKQFDSECRHYYKWQYPPIKKNEIMALDYLSGDEISGKRSQKRQAKKQSKKAAKKEKKQARKTRRKEKVKKIKRKVAKVGLAPARAAFLTAVSLNGAKLATKLARIYKKDPNALKKFWDKFGGDYGKLKQAIAKGAKMQISGDDIGVAVETVLATASPIIIALVPLIKNFKAEGDATEAQQFDNAMDKAKEDLANDPDVETSEVDMPKDKSVAVVKKGGGGDEPTAASVFSPLGLFFKTPLVLSLQQPESPVLALLFAFVSTYCVVGMIVYPFYAWNWLGRSKTLQKFVTPYVELPKRLLHYGKAKIKSR